MYFEHIHTKDMTSVDFEQFDKYLDIDLHHADSVAKFDEVFPKLNAVLIQKDNVLSNITFVSDIMMKQDQFIDNLFHKVAKALALNLRTLLKSITQDSLSSQTFTSVCGSIIMFKNTFKCLHELNPTSFNLIIGVILYWVQGDFKKIEYAVYYMRLFLTTKCQPR